MTRTIARLASQSLLPPSTPGRKRRCVTKAIEPDDSAPLHDHRDLKEIIPVEIFQMICGFLSPWDISKALQTSKWSKITFKIYLLALLTSRKVLSKAKYMEMYKLLRQNFYSWRQVLKFPAIEHTMNDIWNPNCEYVISNSVNNL